MKIIDGIFVKIYIHIYNRIVYYRNLRLADRTLGNYALILFLIVHRKLFRAWRGLGTEISSKRHFPVRIDYSGRDIRSKKYQGSITSPRYIEKTFLRLCRFTKILAFFPFHFSFPSAHSAIGISSMAIFPFTDPFVFLFSANVALIFQFHAIFRLKTFTSNLSLRIGDYF